MDLSCLFFFLTTTTRMKKNLPNCTSSPGQELTYHCYTNTLQVFVKDHCQSVMRISLVHFARALLLEQNRSYRRVEHIQSNVFSRCLVTHGRPCTSTMALFPFLSFFLPPGSANPHTRRDYMPSFQSQIIPEIVRIYY